MRRENSSSESEEERSESDNSVGDIEDHTSDSVGRSSLNSEDDPPENRRPGRDARTRANVTLLFFLFLLLMLTSELGKNKTTRAKEEWEKRLRRMSRHSCAFAIVFKV